jgi:tetratricopeptide (TPR) repeat protein
LQPFGYHLVNILLHALNAILLWQVLRRLEIQGAWWAAAIFALHPVQVESVAWITERKNVLSGMFYLMAMLAWFRFRPLTASETAGARDWRSYLLATLLFLCALLSKTVTCSLPAVIVLLTWWKRGRIGRRDILALIPLFILGAVLGLTTLWMEKHHVGAGREWTLSLLQRCLLAGRALWFYAGKLCWPYPLTFIYPRWTIDASAWWQYLFPLAALVIPITLWLLRRRIGWGPLVAVLCFAGNLVPALGFFDVYPFIYSFVADHFQYLASMALIALAVSTGTTIFKRIGQLGWYLGMFTVAAVLIMFGVFTWRQARVYKSLETLWRDTLTKNPDAWMAHNNLGTVLVSQGKVSEAMAQFVAALRIKPDAEPHNNLGAALASQDKIAEAIVEYMAALRIDPDYAEAHNNLGAALASQGKVSEAITEYMAALRIDPEYAKAHNNLGLALANWGRLPEGIEQYEQALRIRPDYPEAHYNLGNAFCQLGRLTEGIEQYKQALRIKSDFVKAHNNLGTALASQSKVAEAIAEYTAALRIKPDSAEAHNNLGSLLARQGRIPEAMTQYRELLQLKPDFPPALHKLAWILATDGNANLRNAGEAVQLAERLCAITGYQQADALDALAAAYAEAGRFNDAIHVAQKAIELASAAGQQELAQQVQERLKLYQDGQPFHEGPAPTAPSAN